MEFLLKDRINLLGLAGLVVVVIGAVLFASDHFIIGAFTVFGGFVAAFGSRPSVPAKVVSSSTLPEEWEGVMKQPVPSYPLPIQRGEL